MGYSQNIDSSIFGGTEKALLAQGFSLSDL
jgi:hypothetical protein